MYSLGRTILLPEDYEKILAEQSRKGDPADPFVLDPLVVEVDRTYPAAGWLVLLALLAAFAVRG